MADSTTNNENYHTGSSLLGVFCWKNVDDRECQNLKDYNIKPYANYITCVQDVYIWITP